MPYLLTLIFGSLIGFSLGLTGGGGAIFAVPLLVYGLAVGPHEAVGISLAAVGMTSAAGFLHRWHVGEVELGTGLLFAFLGMLGAPLGTWLNSRIPEKALMLLFAGLMVTVATRMWSTSAKSQFEAEITFSPENTSENVGSGPACRRDPAGKLHLTSRCALILAVLGFCTGALSGLFGVGGGFVIVPALVLFSGMEMRRAVGTSLLVISLVSAAGVGAYLFRGQGMPVEIMVLFAAGGLLGLAGGTRAGRKLSGPRLQKVFAGSILGVAAFLFAKNTYLP